MDAKTFKDFIIKITTFCRDKELELWAHQAVLGQLLPLEDLLPRVEAARSNPQILALIRAKYDDPLAKFRATVDKVGIAQAMTAMLLEVQKTQKPN